MAEGVSDEMSRRDERRAIALRLDVLRRWLKRGYELKREFVMRSLRRIISISPPRLNDSRMVASEKARFFVIAGQSNDLCNDIWR
jgi:hypothetical protein